MLLVLQVLSIIGSSGADTITAIGAGTTFLVGAGNDTVDFDGNMDWC